MLVEPESRVFRRWLEDRSEPLVGSELLAVELVRACRRLDADKLDHARRALTHVDLMPVTSALFADAADLPDPHLRSLDAIHLSSAMAIQHDLSAFVAYDRRLAEAASDAGLPVVTPGA